MASAASIETARATQAELARLLGVSRQSVNELVKRNILEVGQDNRIDVQLARVALANRVRPSAKSAQTLQQQPSATGPMPPIADAPITPDFQSDEPTSYHVAKTLREAAEARIAQLKLAELKGQLVRADDVRAVTAKRMTALRESLLQIPARLAAVLAAEPSQARCHDVLQAELHSVLQQITEANPHGRA